MCRFSEFHLFSKDEIGMRSKELAKKSVGEFLLLIDRAVFFKPLNSNVNFQETV